MYSERTILVTGGAGVIGRAVCRTLLADGVRVRVLESLSGQVHGDEGPADLPADVERVQGDVRDADAVRRVLAGVDGVVHLAAKVGVRQSMYAVTRDPASLRWQRRDPTDADGVALDPTPTPEEKQARTFDVDRHGRADVRTARIFNTGGPHLALAG